MKIGKIFFAVIIFTAINISAQLNPNSFLDSKGEVYFKFEIKNNSDLDFITRMISIDKYENGTVYAYANREEFKKFEKLGVEYQTLPHPGDVKSVKMSNDLKSIKEWNVYPTYDAYVAMMNQFAADYPDICRFVDAGTTVNGRKILFIVISDNPNIREEEPQFMYSSTMHGDETTGYVLMLHLIDYLLTNYGTDSRITSLVDNLEIWINPLANPDGTYHGGNSSVSGATRYNANYVDLNRNFPDPLYGDHPDGNDWQPEALAMMNLAENNHYVMSCNFHGGAEVVNYPWDGRYARHADDSWFQYISHQYADTAQAHSSNYMTGFNDGITDGYDWYSIYGGRQDYFTYFRHGREVTIELSDIKLPSASSLPSYWEYNYRSFLNFMEQALFGFQGTVKDLNGSPLEAKVEILNHESLNSEAYSEPVSGYYCRLVSQGTYSIKFSKEGYISQTFDNYSVTNQSATVLNVTLEPEGGVPVELTGFTAEIIQSGVKLEWTTATETNNQGFSIERKKDNSGDFREIAFVAGSGNSTEKKNYSYLDDSPGEGKIVYRLKQLDFDGAVNYSDEINLTVVKAVKFALDQNYPNPFNPTTNIQFSIPVNSFVKLNVYNSIGEKVKTLLSEYLEQGEHRVVFDASELPSGIYYYNLISGEYRTTKKMLLIK